MELLLILVGLSLLVALAMRFGQDSRPHAYSKEEDLGNLGMRWERHPGGLVELLAEANVTRVAHAAERRRQARFLRTGLARLLLALAHWLSPELAQSRAG